MWRSSMAMAAPDEGSASTHDEHHAVAEPLLDPHAEERGDLPHDRAQDLQLVDGGFVAVVVDEVGEPAQVDEGERAVDAPVDGDGGELGGVHDPHWTPCGDRSPPVCDHVHMIVTGSSAVRAGRGTVAVRRAEQLEGQADGSPRFGSGHVSDSRIQPRVWPMNGPATGRSPSSAAATGARRRGRRRGRRGCPAPGRRARRVPPRPRGPATGRRRRATLRCLRVDAGPSPLDGSRRSASRWPRCVGSPSQTLMP